MDVLELLCAVTVRAYDVAVAYETVLIRNKSFKAYRSSCVDLGCGDAYLGSEAVTETVCESRGAVNQNAS